jgi:hypothetical protein
MGARYRDVSRLPTDSGREDTALIAIVEGTRAFQTGDYLSITFDPKRLYLFDLDQPSGAACALLHHF